MSEETNLKTKTKLNKKLLIGAVAVIATALVTLAIFMPKSAAKKLEERLDLGDKYLSKLDYEQAEAAYLAAIEIDPKNVDAYLGLADVYIAQGEYDKAAEVLEDALEELGEDAGEVKDKLDEVEQLGHVAEVTPTVVPTSTPVPTATNTPVPTPVPAASTVVVSEIEYTKVPLESASVGNVVEFGFYEQDNNVSNGTEPIEWLVLDVQEGKALLLSLYGLDAQPYNEEWEAVTWETCTLRAWLNDEFYYSAFSEAQRSRIEETLIANSDNPDWGTKGGNDTLDDVFLLSIDEAERYFPKDATDEKGWLANKYRATRPTAYAIEQGAWYSGSNNWYSGNCWYWLRSPGDGHAYAAGVSERGCVYGYVGADGYGVQGDFAAVRPALWISLDVESADKVVQTPTPTPVLTNTSTPTATPSLTTVETTSIDGFTWIENVDGTLTVWFTNKDATNVVVPREIDGKTVTAIGDWAFYDCKGLTSIEIPDSIISIGDWAFFDCKGLTKIEMPDSVMSIGEWAFFGCSSLTSIEIPDSITSIGEWAFFCCTSLISIEIPNSVTSIGKSAFAYCFDLTIEGVSNNLIHLGNCAFEGCKISETEFTKYSYTILNEKEIVFNGYPMERASSGYIPKTILDRQVVSIGAYAFYYSDITNIEIPNWITSIGEWAFAGCERLTSIEIPENVISIANNAFDDCSSLSTIYTPVGSYAESWAKEKGYTVLNE